MSTYLFRLLSWRRLVGFAALRVVRLADALHLPGPMRTLKPFLLTVALVTLCAAANTAQTPSPENQLAAAEAKWSANKPKAYEFTFKLICFCPPAPPGSRWAEPIVFRVENGVGSLTGSW